MKNVVKSVFPSQFYFSCVFRFRHDIIISLLCFLINIFDLRVINSPFPCPECQFSSCFWDILLPMIFTFSWFNCSFLTVYYTPSFLHWILFRHCKHRFLSFLLVNICLIVFFHHFCPKMFFKNESFNFSLFYLYQSKLVHYYFIHWIVIWYSHLFWYLIFWLLCPSGMSPSFFSAFTY